MESEFIAIAAAGKEAEWLRNILFDIRMHALKIIALWVEVRCCKQCIFKLEFLSINSLQILYNLLYYIRTSFKCDKCLHKNIANRG